MARVEYKGLADKTEPENLPDDTYQLRIVKATHGPGKQDPKKLRVEVILDCPAQPDAQGVFFYIPDKTEDTSSFSELQTARFLTVFGIPFDNDGFDIDDFLGKTAEIRTESTKDETGRENINLKLPPLPKED